MKGRRIFIVEDEYFLADELARDLAVAGCQIEGFAPTLDKAMALAGSDSLRAEAAVVDINLHGQLTYPVVELLQRRGVTVVFCTGYDASTVPKSLSTIPVVLKPATAQRIIAALEAAESVRS